MRAVRVTRLDGPAHLAVAEVAEPRPGPDDVVINVVAAGAAFPDVLMSYGRYQLRPELPFIPGWQVAGTVQSAPPDAAFRPGDRVAAMTVTGGFAEMVAVPQARVLPLPDTIDFAHGAALPVNYLTAHFALRQRGHLRSGDRLLVHGAGGGLGSASVQLGTAWGAEVIGVVSSDEKAAVAKAAGAAHVVAVDGFRQAVADLTQGAGVDLVLDPVGGDRFADSLRCLAIEGRLIVCGFTAGEIPTVRVNRLLLNNTSVVGAGWGDHWHSRPGYVAGQWNDLFSLIESGAVRPVLGTRYSLADARLAVAEIEARRAAGHIVLDVQPSRALSRRVRNAGRSPRGGRRTAHGTGERSGQDGRSPIVRRRPLPSPGRRKRVLDGPGPAGRREGRPSAASPPGRGIQPAGRAH